jgi:hypothetical protein
LGDDSYTGLNPDGSVDTSWITAGGGTVPSGSIPNITDPLNRNLLPSYLNLPQTSVAPNFNSSPIAPGVSASTLLAAAALPNAPAAVKQAAAQYTAANPASSFLSGTTAGIPNMLLIGGVGLLFLIPLMKRK